MIPHQNWLTEMVLMRDLFCIMLSRGNRLAGGRLFTMNLYHPSSRWYIEKHGGAMESSLFSSPEHEVLMVSYCDQSLSVVRALSTFCFKRLLLQNGQTDFEIILQEGSLGDPLPKLLKPFRSIEQDGHQS